MRAMGGAKNKSIDLIPSNLSLLEDDQKEASSQNQRREKKNCFPFAYCPLIKIVSPTKTHNQMNTHLYVYHTKT